ncbi:MAG TPA: SMI1/KNR4 family protein [Chthoniobacteraceae bacterium]
MFLEHFDAAEKHLRAIGEQPRTEPGCAVTAAELDEVERIIDRSIPPELRAFFHEMGDGYRFTPDEEQNGFGVGFLSDYRYNVAGFADSIYEDLPPQEHRRQPRELLELELQRRRNWFPFYNFGCGGYIFCLDSTAEGNCLCYYDVRWPGYPPEFWRATIGNSLLDFIRQWSRFCFSDPVTPDGHHIDLTILAGRLTGRFDWNPKNFGARFDRGTTEA